MLAPFRWLVGRARRLVAVGTLQEALAVLLLLGLLVGLVVWWRAIQDFREMHRGVAFGPTEPIADTASWPLATNVQLETRSPGERRALLRLAREAGVETVRQRFPWEALEPEPGVFVWQPWDDVVQAAAEEGLRLIALLDGSPAWARAPEDAENPLAPPHDVRDFGRFAAAFAARYGHMVDYYQVWDEPNIYPHWGERFPDAEGYAALLREGAAQIRAADPGARILSAALAPTTETGGPNESDLRFLEGLYAAGGAEALDIVGAKAYGFWSGPEDRRMDPGVLNFSRLALLREVMERAGDGGKPIWAVEGGWNALPPDWTGQPSPWGTDDALKQADRTVAALRRAWDEWPWLGLMAVGVLQPAAPEDDPRWGFALLDAEGRPRALFQALASFSQERSAGTGWHPADHFAAQYEGAWRLSPLGADIGKSGDRARFRFRGTRVDLHVRRGDYWAVLYATVDGAPANALPLDGEGRAYVVLYDPLHEEGRVTLARGLPEGVHEVELVAEGGWGQWALLGWSVVQERPLWADPRAMPAISGGVVFCLLALAFIAWPHVERWTRGAAGRLVAWAVATAGSEAEASGLGWLTFVAWVLCGGVYFFAPWLPLGVVGLLGILPLTWIRPDLGLSLLAFGIPFFLLRKPLGGFAFSSLELLLACVLAIWMCRGLVRSFQNLREAVYGGRHWVFAFADFVTQIWHEVCSRWKAMDSGMLLLVVAGALSSAFATVQGVAWNEFRTVILESAVFYGLVRWRPRGLSRAWVWRAADALILAAALLSLWGLGQYVLGTAVIEAEGVRRVRALYGSPNNLALFLERVVPIALAYLIWGRRDWRKGLYSSALVFLMLGLYLTFSRGAWFLALPVSFLVLGALGGRRTFLASVGAVALMALALVPLASTARFQSLLNLQEGTAFFRLQLWQSAGNMLLDHPLWGVGPDNFLYLYRTRYVLPSAWQELNLSHPHNALLDFWTRTGLLGLGAFGVMVVAFFRRARDLWRRAGDPDTRALAAGLMGSMAGALVHGLIDNIYFLVDLAFVYALTMALTVWLCEKEKESACAS